MIDSAKQQVEEQSYTGKLKYYYRYHARFYDSTRWSFLFGREELLHSVPDLPPKPRILEIGCGTGKNLLNLGSLFPDANIYGIDLSSHMIRRAKKRVIADQQFKLIHGAYGSEKLIFESFDLILLSYTLTMLGDHMEQILQQVYNDLAPGGYIAVVDFDTSDYRWFRKWMKANHVDMEGHLLSLLNKFFSPVHFREKKAYLGLWSYIQFVGRRG